MSTGNITVGLDVTGVAEVCLVRSVSPLLTALPGLLGAIDLRGRPVPLFDPRPIAGLPHGTVEPRVAVVAVRDGRRIALGFDAIEGLIHVSRDRLEQTAGLAEEFFAGTLETDGRIVSLVEPRALLARSDLPASAEVASVSRGAAAASEAVLTFDAGGARFGIRATGVEATVPRQSIESEGLADGAWLGNIRHHGRRVPVMHLNKVLGIGATCDLRVAEVVIVRFPEGRLLGLAVETIRRMQLVSLANARPVPPLLADRTLGIRRIVPDAADCDTYLIDLDALHTNDALLGMAALSEAPVAASRDEPRRDPEGARRERERYLVAEVGSVVALPIRQVARIVMPPQRITPLARAPAWVRGVFREDGATIPLVDLAQRLGHAPTEVSDRARVILTGPRDTPTGFIVSGVDHLEWSCWRSDQAAADGMVTGLVSLPRLGTGRVVPVIDLGRLDHAGHG